MRPVLAFLAENRERLRLDRYLGREVSAVMLTPRFPASRHVVVLLTPVGRVEPVLVAKVPRLEDDTGGLEREAASLRAVASRTELIATVPRVVAFEEYRRRSILLETWLAGTPVSAATIHRRTDRSVSTVLGWLHKLAEGGEGKARPAEDWYPRLVEEPLRRFAALFPAGGAEPELVERTLELLTPLAASQMQLVMEHGDLNPPNLIRLRNGRLGVVDWEAAEPEGLPFFDLFFFLSFVTFTLRGARTVPEHLAALDDDFLRRSRWQPRLEEYADQLSLDRALVPPLFIACWARYTAMLLFRVVGGDTADEETRAWLTSTRFYAIWRHVVARAAKVEKLLS